MAHASAVSTNDHPVCPRCNSRRYLKRLKITTIRYVDRDGTHLKMSDEVTTQPEGYTCKSCNYSGDYNA